MEDNTKTPLTHSDVPQKKAMTLKRWHMVAFCLLIYDLIVGAGSYFVALWLRFDCRYTEIPHEYLMTWLKFAPIYAVVIVFVFWMMRFVSKRLDLCKLC